MLTPFAWHHVALTYDGVATETLYVDGARSTYYANRALRIAVGPALLLGAYNVSGVLVGGDVAVGTLRFHGGTLTATDVAYNYGLSVGVYAPTPTATPSSTASNTWVPTLTRTPTPTASPLSPFPVGLTLSTLPSGNFLNFIELFAFSDTGQDVAAGALGATASWAVGSGYSTQYASNGIDLFCDPWLAYAANPQLIAGSSAGGATWAVAFPPGPGYPGGFPSPVSSVVFVNRLDAGLNARINTSVPGVLSLLAANATVLSTAAVSSMSVSVFTFPNNAQQGPIWPSNPRSTAPAATFQASAQNQLAYVRYVNITAAPGRCLFFRELYALDATYTNVALYKPSTASAPAFFDPSFGAFTSNNTAFGTDGVIDMDGPAGNMVNLGCAGIASWQVRSAAGEGDCGRARVRAARRGLRLEVGGLGGRGACRTSTATLSFAVGDASPRPPPRARCPGRPRWRVQPDAHHLLQP